MAFGDYEVLVVLSEAPERRMRMSELAEELCLSPSGLTRRLDRLTRDGLVGAGAVPRRPPGQLRRAHRRSASPAWTRPRPTTCVGSGEHLLDHLDRRQMRVLGEALAPVAEACPWRVPVRRPQVA